MKPAAAMRNGGDDVKYSNGGDSDDEEGAKTTTIRHDDTSRLRTVELSRNGHERGFTGRFTVGSEIGSVVTLALRGFAFGRQSGA